VIRCGGSISKIGCGLSRSTRFWTKRVTRLFTARVTDQILFATSCSAVAAMIPNVPFNTLGRTSQSCRKSEARVLTKALTRRLSEKYGKR